MSGHGDQRGVRVILVGRTGLDQSLRAAPEVELLRVRTTLEAIGELAQPLDAESPEGAIVVVGDQGSDRVGRNGVESAEFVEAARRVEPRVVVVGVAGSDSERGFDGVVRGASDVLALMERCGTMSRSGQNGTNGVGASRDAGRQAPSAVETLISSILRGKGEGAESAATSAAHAPVTAGGVPIENDAAMVEAVLRGRDVVEPALEVLRARLRVGDVKFQPGAVSADALASGGVPVAWGEAVFGALIAPGVGPEALRGHAAWLAGWLRLRDQQAELRTAAFKDPLTGAWNRRYFDRFLTSAVEQCRVSRRTMTLMVFDIDDFKKYNDRYGHGAGDEILAETVRLMTSVVRPTDRVCRIGGDEFGVIFFEPDGPREQNSRHPDSVCKIAARFQQQIGRHKFPKLGSDAPGSLTISGGLATYPWDGATPEQLVARADERSMESKQSGKNALTLGPSAIRRGE